MVARIWRVSTRKIHVGEYLDYLRETGLKVYVSIRAFAGADVDRACYYPEDDRYLLNKSETVDHFEIVFDSHAG